MKHLTKALTIMLTIALAVSLVACGGAASSTPAASGSDSSAASDASSTTKGEWPEETITLVVPFSAGSGTDLGARNLATPLSKILGVNVVVENVTGSGGWVGWNQVLHTNPTDGYTIGVLNHNFAMGAYDDAAPREDTLDDLQLLANQVIDYNVLAIRSDETRFTDVASFIEYAKANPILISAQTGGITDGDASTAQWFNKNYGTQIDIVPVDGASDGRSMFLAGDTDIFFASVGDVYTAHNNGELKTICVFAPERSSYLPDVATLSELGLGDFIGFACRGYFYADGVDPAIVKKVQDAMAEAMADPEYIKAMDTLGLTLNPVVGDEFYKLLNSQLETRKEIWGVQ